MGSCQSIAEVVTYGFIMRLMGSFQLWCIGFRVVAAKAVYELGFSTITRIEIGECGCIGPVIKMLARMALEEKEATVKALSILTL